MLKARELSELNRFERDLIKNGVVLKHRVCDNIFLLETVSWKNDQLFQVRWSGGKVVDIVREQEDKNNA